MNNKEGGKGVGVIEMMLSKVVKKDRKIGRPEMRQRQICKNAR